ncbi:MAG: four helix bundle protein [Prevotella sp.]|nr:four helix bundle protein [Prevotella sp.]
MEDTSKARNFRQYTVWKDAVAYATYIYKVTDQMPWFEKKGICDQLRRAAVSIGSNIAEGSAKPSDVDFARFLDQALGSAYEVETQLIISQNVGYITEEQNKDLIKRSVNLQKQLVALIRSIRSK